MLRHRKRLRHAVEARVWKTEKYACLTRLASDVPKTSVFVGCLTRLTLSQGKNIFVSFPKTMSDVSDIPQKPLSWARLTQAVSDMHIFLLSTHEHLQFFVCVCVSKNWVFKMLGYAFVLGPHGNKLNFTLFP